MRCLRCGIDVRCHLVIDVEAVAEWRGANFDADAARGAVGLAVMDALGLSPRRRNDFEAFTREVRVLAIAPQEGTPPPAPWEFHVAIARDLSDERVDAIARGAIAALESAKGFQSPRRRA